MNSDPLSNALSQSRQKYSHIKVISESNYHFAANLNLEVIVKLLYNMNFLRTFRQKSRDVDVDEAPLFEKVSSKLKGIVLGNYP